MGSVKFQTRTADVCTRPAASTRSAKDAGSAHATATTPFRPGSQSTADTWRPLLYTRSVKDWYSWNVKVEVLVGLEFLEIEK
jgi:hypothetical protein